MLTCCTVLPRKVPLYALLLFGGPIVVDHVRGGLTVGGRAEGTLRLRAWPRIAILVQQLRCVYALPSIVTLTPTPRTVPHTDDYWMQRS